MPDAVNIHSYTDHSQLLSKLEVNNKEIYLWDLSSSEFF